MLVSVEGYIKKNWGLRGENKMYFTKTIEIRTTLELTMKAIDKEANAMNNKGYDLVCYTFVACNELVMMTFKQREQ